MRDTMRRSLSLAEKLLHPGEEAIPAAVQQTIRFFEDRGLWYALSRNHEARSCRDAAHKRWRLGHEGIPLWDEMKSFFGSFIGSSGREQLFVAHCRADRRLDLERLRAVLDAKEVPRRLTVEEVERLGTDYGLVNPFGSATLTAEQVAFVLDAKFLEASVLQVFDKDLVEPIGLPGTVMTNAGDLTWAVEFFTKDVVRSISDARVEDIAVPDEEEQPRVWGVREHRRIGIITGNAPESGIALWNLINAEVRELLGPNCTGDVSMPPVFVDSVPGLGLSMELDTRTEEIWKDLEESIVRLCQQGVSLLALACNTTPYFTPRIRDICKGYGTQFVSMPEVVGQWLKVQEIKQIALVGIRYVTELGEWSAYTEPLKGIAVEHLSKRALGRIQELAYQVKSEGVNEAGLNRLRDILHQEVESQHVVLALTELSLLMVQQRKQGKSGKVLIDTLSLYADRITREYLSLPEVPETPTRGSSINSTTGSS